MPERSVSTFGPPPGPPGVPVLGSVEALRAVRGAEPLHISLTRLARQYGDVCLFRLGGVPTVLLAHPDRMAEAFGKGEISGRFRNEIFTCLSEAEGLIFADYNENWRTLSELAKSRLWSVEDVETLCRNHFAPAADALADRMGRMADEGEPVPAHKALFDSVYDMTFRALFGQPEEIDAGIREKKEALRERIVWFDGAASEPNPADVLPWLKVVPSKMLRKARREMAARDPLIFDLVEAVAERRAAGRPAVPGMVDLMLDKEESGEIARSAVHALCMDILGAVPSGVSATIAWFLLIVANRPEVQAKIHEELDRTLGRDGAAPTIADRARLPYAFACVAESMRYRTIAVFGIPHLTAREVEVGGYRIPAGSQVFGNIYSIHHDPRFWESPDEFAPERFLPRADGSPPAALSDPAYIPFGIGVRKCTGDHFAVGAFWLYATRILRALRLETPDGAPLSEDEVFAVSVKPAPYVLKASRRR